MHELIKEIERQLEMDRVEEGNMSAEDVLYIVKGFKRPYLNENQQIVLKHLKSMCPPKLGLSAMVTVYCLVDDNINDNWQEYSEEIPEHIEALQKLSVAEENQVLQAFSQWALGQEEE
ncbi:hypothetical protein [Enterococcus faecalis]|uniref:hypothetical protein n=1 Tax=Enterococcus faecalis TaxID=1351 RepID=UPI0022243B77|nr:hypothetical protein [Enterococcus faecalis]UYY36706.1 hypothetical protein OLL95_04520 [Enterococcus faecalis]UYY39523.1 hypothetical protein OLL92_04515 [Enterococcus faecalis]HCR3094693.1 hypothetical protein [Enterococcus faecalis]HCR3970720.1 hypothetical protein [Enterococcus faecalis]